MTFLSRHWKHVILIGLAACSIGTFVYLRNDTPQKPTILYKTTEPSKSQTNRDKTVVSTAHSHDHSHDTTLHSHTVQEFPSGNTDDWRDDGVLDAPRAEADPWKQTYTQETDVESSEETNDETYPPRDWYKTEDPELFIEYFRAQLIQQFGDIEEVHIVVDREEKRKLGIPVSLDEQISFLEAQYYLWPDDNTLKALKSLRTIKAKAKHGEH